jgi:hypothetical protein
VREEGFRLVVVDELDGLITKDVGAVAREAARHAVDLVDVVEVVVTPAVGRVADAAAADR